MEGRSFFFQGSGTDLFTVISQAFYTKEPPTYLQLEQVANPLPSFAQGNLDYFTRQTDGFNFDELMALFNGCTIEQWTYMTRQDRSDPNKYHFDGLNCQIWSHELKRNMNEQVPPPTELLYRQLYFLFNVRIKQAHSVCTFCPLPNAITLGNLPVIRRISYRAVTREILALSQKDKLGNTHKWISPRFFDAVFFDLLPTVNGVTKVKLSWVDSRFEKFSQYLLNLLGYKNDQRHESQSVTSTWVNELWYTALTIEERQRYDWLRPYKESWEKGETTDNDLASESGKSVDTIRRWRRDLKSKNCPDMDWQKQA